MNILIVKTSAIGDVTHTLPSLNALRRRFPNAAITWLAENPSAEIVKGHLSLDSVLVCERKRWKKKLRKLEFAAAAKEILAFVKKLRSREYDLVIDFQGLFRSAILVFLARGARKIGFGPGMQHSEASYLFYNEKIPAVSMEYHAVDRYLLLLSAIGVPTAKVEFDFPIESSDRESIRALLKRSGVDSDDRIAAINPVARWRTKLWAPGLFAETADRIARKGYKVCFTGAKNDAEQIDEIVSMMTERAANFAGKTSLRQLAALYEKVEFVVTTDTGPMHIAAAVGTPTIALFGPTAPWRTGPYGEGHRIVTIEKHCAPCFRRECPHIDCMKKITPDMVMKEVDAVIENARRQSAR